MKSTMKIEKIVSFDTAGYRYYEECNGKNNTIRLLSSEEYSELTRCSFIRIDNPDTGEWFTRKITNIENVTAFIRPDYPGVVAIITWEHLPGQEAEQ
jgi:hypothetical protein